MNIVLYRVNIVQILYKYCANIAQISYKYSLDQTGQQKNIQDYTELSVTHSPSHSLCEITILWAGYTAKNIYKYCANIVYIVCILIEFYPNIVQIFYKYLFNLVSFQFTDDDILFKYWQIFARYSANIVQILFQFCQNIV